MVARLTVQIQRPAEVLVVVVEEQAVVRQQAVPQQQDKDFQAVQVIQH